MEGTKKGRALAGVMMTIFLAAMESTVVATAMPNAVGSLGGIEIYSWVGSGFLLTATVMMPLWGRLSDLYGRRPIYVIGVIVFLLGSALSGAAQTMGQLIGFRMIQGLGAGSLMTIGMTIVGELYGLERRARMQGYLSGVWGIASLLGPLIGGLLTDHVSWRWVFYINLPFGVIAIALVVSALREDRSSRRRAAIDYAGIALFTTGVSALLLALEATRTQPSGGPAVVGAGAVAFAALAGFVGVERRAAEPIVPLRLFTNRMVLAASATGFLAGMAMFGAIQFVPLFLQAVGGMTATGAGIVLIPFVLGWVVMSIVSARLVLRVGYRGLVVAGMACLVGGFVLLSRWSPSLTLPAAMRDALVGGVGMGLTMVPMLIAVQSAVERSELGTATSMTQFFRTIGGAIGISLMGAVMGRRLASGLDMSDALHGVFVVGLGVAVVALASAFLVPGGRAQDLARGGASGAPARPGAGVRAGAEIGVPRPTGVDGGRR
ncbi:MAG: MFS transporter [Candidatus Rokubacteria bacterium]|nr:MFS transporter [Candidatus Rokubacteria bacterium]